MTEPVPGGRRVSTLTAVVGTVALVGAIFVLPIVLIVLVSGRAIEGDGPPSCDREPVVVEWTEWVEGDGRWRRSQAFELVEEVQVVQVDVSLSRDGGVIQLGNTVYAVPSGAALPEPGETSSTTQPFAGVRVGHGVDAVNEQVTLAAGAWQLAVTGGASPAELRWPC